MPIVHNFTDREKKKFNIKAISISLIVIGVGAIVYFLVPKSLYLRNNDEPTIVTKLNVCIDYKLQTNLKEIIDEYITNNNEELQISQSSCDIEIVRNPNDTNPYNLIYSKIYVPVSSVLVDTLDFPSDNLIAALNSQSITNYNIIWDRQTDDFLRSKYSLAVGQTIYAEKEIQKKLALTKSYIAIIPFEQLKANEKEVKANGNSIFDETFQPSSYFLTDSIWIKGNGQARTDIEAKLKTVLGETNYKQENITTVLTSGSSFIGSDKYQELIAAKKDSSYMISNIKDMTKNADIFQMSNGVSVSGRCYQNSTATYLCSNRNDMSVLKTLGTDVVGVTGNHILDFGLKSFRETLNWYTANKIQYFGGGSDSIDSHTPRVVTRNGVKFAFIGYNFVPPYSYYSTATKAGSNNVSLNIMKNDLAKAKKLADVVFVDFSIGNEFDTKPNNNTKENERYAISHGATVTLGVNGYNPQGMEINPTSGIFYSLGGFINAKSGPGMLVKHIFYGKKYIGFELYPLARDSQLNIRLAEGAIKDTMLNTVFKQSNIKYEK